MRTFYDEHLSPYSDLLSVKDIQQITGFSSSAIVRWISTGILKAFQPGKQYTVPKDFMLDFLIAVRAMSREIAIWWIRPITWWQFMTMCGICGPGQCSA